MALHAYPVLLLATRLADVRNDVLLAHFPSLMAVPCEGGNFEIKDVPQEISLFGFTEVIKWKATSLSIFLRR